jgi:hypothetical protein
LHSYKQVAFGDIAQHVGDDSDILIWLAIVFVLVLLFKNSSQKLKDFQFNYVTLFMSIILFVCGVLSLSKVSEFLYFNF